MRGWITDCHPSDDDQGVVLWLRTAEGHMRVQRPLRPSFLVAGGDLKTLARDVEGCGAQASMQRARTRLAGPMVDVLRVSVEGFQQMTRLARTVDRWGSYRDHELYNVDLSPSQRFMLPRGLFPFGLMEADADMRSLDSPLRLSYPLPPLRTMMIDHVISRPFDPRPDDVLKSISVDGVPLKGDEEGMLRELSHMVEEGDPDIIMVDRGDKGRTSHLFDRARSLGLDLCMGREAGVRSGPGKSYHSYGRTVYKPPALKLKGRIHLDTSSFMYSEGGLGGLIELSRLSGLPLQDLSRLSPGTAISAMQSDHALRGGNLLRWKKNVPEDFKSVSQLVVCDRGGMIHQPSPGVHEDVLEMDFASMYPSIISRFNISPETLECDCCPSSEDMVPGLGYRICRKRRGLLPAVLGPLVERRRAFKHMARTDPARAELHRQRSKLLKWVLVTCFGYTGYRNARFGRIECHEAITAYGREIMLSTAEMASDRGMRVIHGIVDSLWLQGRGDHEALAEEVKARYGIPLEVEGRYRWIVFLPNLHNGAGALNRYYGVFEDGEMKIRGLAARKRDCVGCVRDFQTRALDSLSRARDQSEMEEMVPEVLDMLRSWTEKVYSGEVSAEDITLVRRTSKMMGEYRQFNDSRAAAEVLASFGHEPLPGQSMAYIIRDSAARKASRKVSLPEFWDGVYDRERYVDMLVRSAEEILIPFGWDRDRIRSFIGPQRSGPGFQSVIS